MPRKLIQRYLPDPNKLREIRGLGILGDRLFDPNLFHLTRHSASLAAFVGIFFAFVPFPTQMLFAALVALWVRCNMPMTLALVWITNPITIAPIFYFSYSVGAFMLNTPVMDANFDLSGEELREMLKHIWKPLVLGSLSCGLVFGGIAYCTVRIAWRVQIVNRWRHRQSLRKDNKTKH